MLPDRVIRISGRAARVEAELWSYTGLPGEEEAVSKGSPVVVPLDDSPDERYLYLSDVLPTAWQAVEYANIPAGGSVVVMGLGPVGQMAARIALHRGAGTVFGVDNVPERLAMARRHGVEVIDTREQHDVVGALRDRTDGRGPDASIDAVGMEAHGSPLAHAAHAVISRIPDALAGPLIEHAGMDRLDALHTAIAAVRRGGVVSVVGVYGGAVDPMPMMDIFDRQLTLRFGQANVLRWVPDLLPLVADPSDPLGVLDLRTHRWALEDAPDAYAMFQTKADGCIKVVLDPAAARNTPDPEEVLS